MVLFYTLFSLMINSILSNNVVEANNIELLLFTVATEANDGFLRFLRSAEFYGYNVTVLGQGTQWTGGDILRYPGGGQKVNLLRKAIAKADNHLTSSQLIMFVDSYDVVLSAGPQEVIRKFKKFNANVVFSAEDSCWPDISLAPFYPAVKVNEKRYLNSGGYIGYLSEISELLVGDIKDSDDDQFYFTKQFLDEEKRSKLRLKLDIRSAIFQNLNGAFDDITLKFRGMESCIYNDKTGHVPVVIHGNGPIKNEFNSLTNYLVYNWVPRLGCLACKEHTFNLNKLKEEYFPRVFVAIFIEYPTVFLDDFFQHVVNLVYPKEKIDLYMHYSGIHCLREVSKFTTSHSSKYSSFELYGPYAGLNDKEARNLALKRCAEKNCDYFFSIDSEVQLENVQTLNLLISQNRSLIAPLLSRPGRVWSNFWGALTVDGFYKRAVDYMGIVERTQLGLWNVPYVSSAYLINGRLLSKLQGAYSNAFYDSDMAFCMKMREKFIFMYVDNQVQYGYLTDSSNYDMEFFHNDLYAIFDNRYAWEQKYIDPEYYNVLRSKTHLDMDQPCRDVFTMPLMKPVFGQHLIEEMEQYGRWSSSTIEDTARAEIHLTQVGFVKHWLHIIREFILPVNAILYQGYSSQGDAILNYVVRYRRGEQNYSRSQKEISTFTVSIGLNQPGVDFQGGGIRFMRYNCTVSNGFPGWLLLFPGHITHRHEVLAVSEGTQYSLVSFVDP